jgi:hypothetical protein
LTAARNLKKGRMTVAKMTLLINNTSLECDEIQNSRKISHFNA